MKPLIVFFLATFLSISLHSQVSNGIVKGRVLNSTNNEPVAFATIQVENTTIGVSADTNGYFEITKLEPGFKNLLISGIGFKSYTYRDVLVNNGSPAIVEIKLEEDLNVLKEFTVQKNPFNKIEESPVSVRTIGIAEIERNPGGNRDISSVLRSFPGVASTPAFRNDIIIRGGAPNENRFYLDDVEVPVINHFQTQGGSGGPVGIINVNLIREVNFYSGAFPANRGNTMSSVLDFKQIDGNNERWKYRFTLGSSDAGFTADGPIGKKTSLIVSVRASYLQLLFTALQLPFLPTYYDAQFKYKIKFDTKNELYFIGLGGIDLFKLNLAANETKSQQYLLNNLPVNNQWNYTIGAVYKHYGKYTTHTLVLSRNMLNNRAYKYQGNDENDPSKKILDYSSIEAENKFRYEMTWKKDGWKVNAGINAEYAKFTNSTYNIINTFNGIDTLDFSSELNMFNGGIFGSVYKSFFKDKLGMAFGVRFENSSYNSYMAAPWNQFSPRFSLSYNFIKRWSFNFNIGRYYQRAPYTVLGYSEGNGILLNQNNNIRFINCDHIVAGLEYTPTNNTKISVEGFFKYYRDYPFSLRDSITLANLGADFGVVGNVPAVSKSEGRSYGMEVLVQQKLWKGFYGILAYTFVRSEFQDKDGNYVPSSWDSRHLFTLTAGYKFKKNWEVGLRFRLVDGQPYTPYDTALSMLKPVWDVTGRGISDYRLLNSGRIPVFHQLDIRIDKVWYFKHWSFNLYVDVQNVYNWKAEGRPNLTVATDANGNPITDPNDPNRYQSEFLPNLAGTVLPTLGVIIDFTIPKKDPAKTKNKKTN